MKAGPVKLAPPYPYTERAAYVRFMSAHWTVWSERVRNEFGLIPARRQDDLGGLLEVTFRQLFDFRSIDSFLHMLAQRLDKRSAGYLRRVVRLPPGRPQAQKLIDDFRQRNLDLIQGLGDEHIKDLRETFRKATALGTWHEEIAKDINARLGVGLSRATLIARDQTNKLNSQMQVLHQTAAGVESFVWSTSKDGAVRPSHRALEGQTFSYASPPIVDGEVALPGQPVQCRCTPIPVIPLFAVA